ncbi:MAG: GDSL-type esterase/lipase family protein [Ginsengibacter sp.]
MKKTIHCLLLFVFCYTGLNAQNSRIKIACVGNSVTYGAGLKDPVNQSYPALLQEKMGAGYDIKNFGRSGATLLRNGHNPYFKTDEFKAVVAFKPDIAVIHLGLNDTDPRNWNNYRNEFKGDYTWLIDTFRKQNPDVKIFICLTTPIFNDHPRFLSGTRDWHAQIQTAITKIALAENVSLIDLHTPFYFRPDLFPDALHPNEEGVVKLAKTIYSAITGDYGGLQMPFVFANDMVLQRDQPIPIFGTANAGEEVVVKFNHKVKKVIAGSDGKWKIILDESAAGGPYQLEVKTSKKQIHFQNILMGDVWLLAGQSNMLFRLNEAKEGKKGIDSSNNNQLRFLQLNALRETDNIAWDSTVLKRTNELSYFSGSWQTSSSETATKFSAIGYFFGSRIQKETKVPIGLIQVAAGGAPIVSFLDRHTLEQDSYLVNELYNWRKSDYLMPWVRERALKNIELSKDPKQRHPYEPAYIFEAGLSSFTQTPIKGIVWYQGESDAHNIELYQYNFEKLIQSWRSIWNKDLPVYFVQLSSIDRPSWPYFRDMQRKVSEEVPNTFMAVSSDVGDSLDVHPKEKKIVGERLALLALKNTYQKKIIAEGPAIEIAIQSGNKLILFFKNAQKLQTRNKEVLQGFEVMDEKGNIYLPKAEMNKNTVILSLPTKYKISKVLYGYKPFTRANLENDAGLPASTFLINVSIK